MDSLERIVVTLHGIETLNGPNMGSSRFIGAMKHNDEGRYTLQGLADWLKAIDVDSDLVDGSKINFETRTPKGDFARQVLGE